MKRQILIFIVLIYFLSISKFIIGQENSYDVKITVPDRDGAHVGKTIDIEGEASIPEGEFLWILIHRIKGFKYVWFPQDNGEINPETKHWEVTATIGKIEDIGYDFEIVAIVVNDLEHRKLIQYIEYSMTSGDWKPIKMPPTQTAPVYRKIKKVSH